MEKLTNSAGSFAIIDHGRSLSTGSPAELKSEVGPDSIKLALENDNWHEQGAAELAREGDTHPGINGVITSSSPRKG